MGKLLMNSDVKHFIENASEAELHALSDDLQRQHEQSVEQMRTTLMGGMATSKKPYKYVIIPEIGG